MFDDDVAPSDHSALKDFSFNAFKVSHAIGKAVKGMFWGLVIATAALAVISVTGGGALVAGGPWAWLATAVGWGGANMAGYSVGAMVAKIAVGTLLAGGAIGAAAGTISGISGAEDAAEDEAAKRVFLWDKGKAREQAAEAFRQKLEDQRQQMNKQGRDLGYNNPGHTPMGGLSDREMANLGGASRKSRNLI